MHTPASHLLTSPPHECVSMVCIKVPLPEPAVLCDPLLKPRFPAELEAEHRPGAQRVGFC